MFLSVRYQHLSKQTFASSQVIPSSANISKIQVKQNDASRIVHSKSRKDPGAAGTLLEQGQQKSVNQITARVDHHGIVESKSLSPRQSHLKWIEDFIINRMEHHSGMKESYFCKLCESRLSLSPKYMGEEK